MVFTYNVIKHETIVLHSHQSNEVAEHFNHSIQHLVSIAGIEAGLPRNLWGKAIAILNHVKNRLTHSHLRNMAPFEAYHGR